MSKTFAKTTAGERLYGNSTLCPYPLLDCTTKPPTLYTEHTPRLLYGLEITK